MNPISPKATTAKQGTRNLRGGLTGGLGGLTALVGLAGRTGRSGGLTAKDQRRKSVLKNSP